MNGFTTSATIVLVAVVAAWTVANVARLYFRSKNIQAHGWPPPYLDADGDQHDVCYCQREPDPEPAEQGAVRT